MLRLSLAGFRHPSLSVWAVVVKTRIRTVCLDSFKKGLLVGKYPVLINVFEALMKGGRYHAVDPSRKFRRCHRQSRKK